MEKTVILPALPPAIDRVISAASRYNVVASCLKGWKTALAVEVAVADAKHGALGGKRALFLSASESGLADARQRISRATSALLSRRPDAKRIELVTKGSVDFKLIDSPTLDLLEQYHLVVVDDASLVVHLDKIWKSSIRQALARFCGSAWLIGKPKGDTNAFARLYKHADSGLDASWYADRLQAKDFPQQYPPAVLSDLKASLPPALYAQEYETEFVHGVIELSAAQCVIGKDETFYDWCQRLAGEGLKVDGMPFRLDNRPSMIPIYQAIPTSPEEAFGRIVVVRKGSQLGFTVWEMLANIYMAIKFEPCVIGMFLPDQATAGDKSSRRFVRIVKTIPAVYERLTTQPDQDGRVKRTGEGNVMTRVMGESAFLFLWVSGKVSTESRPIDVLSFDEVQGMALDQIDKTLERLSASRIRFVLMLSTANFPDADIDFWYKLGDRKVWMTECPACGAESDLSEAFPGCVAYNDGQIPGAPLNDYVYVCPSCGGHLADTQRGRCVTQNAGSRIESFHYPQTVSPTITARDMIESWGRAVTGDQKKSFYNRKLGLPYVDKDQVPITLAVCQACVDEGIRAGLRWETSGTGTYMGVDQMGGFNAVIIKRRMADGRQAVIHVEAIFGLDPFKRTGDLMDQYGVGVCVMETLPNYNDAHKFANRFPGRVFLASYADLKDSAIIWGDSLSLSDRKTTDEDKDRYSVTLQQYKVMQTAMARIVNRNCLFPDPALLEQDVIERGVTKRIAILRDWVFYHFTKTALVVEMDDDSRKLRAKVLKIGIDPHFSFSNMLCDVAWTREQGGSVMILPRDDDQTRRPMEIRIAREAVVDVPAEALQMGESVALSIRVHSGEEPTCGVCENFAAGRCSVLECSVSSADIACEEFSSVVTRD